MRNLPWPLLVAPAVRLATDGFTMSQRSSEAWAQFVREVLRDANLSPAAAEDFFRTHFGKNLPRAGDQVTNLALARSLEDLAEGGCARFYGKDGPMKQALAYAKQQLSFCYHQLLDFPQTEDIFFHQYLNL